MTSKIGAILLSIWSGLNLVVGVAVTAVTLMKRDAPALSMMFSDADIAHLDHKVVAVVNAQAAFANPCIVAICLLVLAIVWTNLIARKRWSFFALAISLVPLQAFAFVSDGFLGHRNLIANVASTAVLLAGLALSGLALFRAPSVRAASAS